MTKYFIFILIALSTISCHNKHSKQNTLGKFDISKDDKEIIFSAFTVNKGSSIYTSDIDGSNLKILISATKSKSYYNPKFSPNGKKIVFFECDINNINKGIICISNYEGKDIQRFDTGNEIVSQAIFSNDNDNILFCKANEYKKYSPIGRKQAHGMDIFSINIFTKKMTKISNLKSYGIFQISEVDNSILMHISKGKDGGMFLLNKDTPNKVKRIIPINNPRKDASLYYTPIYSKKYDKIAFIAPYELYIMDLKNKKANLVFDNKGQTQIEYLCFYNNDRKILFNKNNEISVYSINYDGLNLKKISLNINNLQ